ncbi:MAG: cell filamentation protein Fic [Flavobacteriaceae bacterium]|nr:MAG: cell filamentation protein Fic [Flavobacteriaceae bacterium]
MTYNWQQSDWKEFFYSKKGIEKLLFSFTEKMGNVKGYTEALSKNDREQTLIDFLVTEAIKTSEIEGEFLSREDVMSSVKNNLGLLKQPDNIRDLRAKGIAKLVTEVHNNFQPLLSKQVLFDWHSTMMPVNNNINTGSWRTGKAPMQIVSGSFGKEEIHFEAPPSENVPLEMEQFIYWFNNTAPGGKSEIIHAPIRSAIAHLYFESIHPFEDGNGRIGRVIAEKALLQTLGYSLLISLSPTLELNMNAYYEALKEAQRGNDITKWLIYFCEVLNGSLDVSIKILDFTIKKTALFDRVKIELNERQLKVIQKMMSYGIVGFEGGMSAKKYTKIAKTSKATATRDLKKLLEMDVLKVFGEGRNTSYELNV